MDVLEFYTDQLKGRDDNFNMNSLNSSLTQVASSNGSGYTPSSSTSSSITALNGRPRDDDARYPKKSSISNSGSNPVMKQGLSPMPVKS